MMCALLYEEKNSQDTLELLWHTASNRRIVCDRHRMRMDRLYATNCRTSRPNQ